MKLVDRSKLNLNEDGVVINNDFNTFKMTLVERIWFTPEIYLRKHANVFWFILFLWCPWVNQIMRIDLKDILNITLGELFTLLLMLTFTFLCLGPIFHITNCYMDIKKTHRVADKYKSKRIYYEEIYDQYHKIKLV